MSDDGMMCPHCGKLVRLDQRTGLTAPHPWSTSSPSCPGSGQHPRYAYSDARPLWSGDPNPHFGKEPWR